MPPYAAYGGALECRIVVSSATAIERSRTRTAYAETACGSLGAALRLHGYHLLVERIRIGCSGWNYDHWRNGVFYPPRLPARSWLAYYAEHFDTVEVNATFYRLPRPSSVARWVEVTPDDFVISFKASRYLTHVKRLRDLPGHVDLLLDRVAPLVESPKLGPMLWQLPPTFARDDERLASALEQLPPGLRHAVEFRHESWFADEVFELLRVHGVALVLADRARSPALRRCELTADFAYVRLHEGRDRGNYSHAELGRWVAMLGRLAERAEVFAYFNNDWHGYAVENALYVKRSLEQSRRFPTTASGTPCALVGPRRRRRRS
jgi:uncharacterized protein YecE (DUF72 family)